MPSSLGRSFSDMSQIAGICPCCGELFYVSEARPYHAASNKKSFIDSLRAAELRLEKEEERLQDLEIGLREAAATSGLKTAKKLLKKIDPVFSGGGLDPQDVKVMFDPVTYVVFNGLSRGKVKEVALLAKEPISSDAEKIQTSLRAAVEAGNYEFRIVHVDRDGSVSHR